VVVGWGLFVVQMNREKEQPLWMRVPTRSSSNQQEKERIRKNESWQYFLFREEKRLVETSCATSSPLYALCPTWNYYAPAHDFLGPVAMVHVNVHDGHPRAFVGF